MKKLSIVVLLGIASLAVTPAFAGTDLSCESGEPSGMGSTLDIELDVVAGDHVLGSRVHASLYNFKTKRRSARDYFKSRILRRGDRVETIEFVLDKDFTIEIRLPNDEIDFHNVIITPSKAAQKRGFEAEELSCNE